MSCRWATLNPLKISYWTWWTAQIFMLKGSPTHHPRWRGVKSFHVRSSVIRCLTCGIRTSQRPKPWTVPTFQAGLQALASSSSCFFSDQKHEKHHHGTHSKNHCDNVFFKSENTAKLFVFSLELDFRIRKYAKAIHTFTRAWFQQANIQTEYDFEVLITRKMQLMPSFPPSYFASQ